MCGAGTCCSRPGTATAIPAPVTPHHLMPHHLMPHHLMPHQPKALHSPLLAHAAWLPAVQITEDADGESDEEGSEEEEEEEEEEEGSEEEGGEGDEHGGDEAAAARSAARRAKKAHAAVGFRLNKIHMFIALIAFILLADVLLFLDSASFWKRLSPGGRR